MATQDSTNLTPVDPKALHPLQTDRIGATWMGDKVTNTEARKLVADLQDWAAQFHHPEALKLQDSLRDMERLFTTVWTEIDEALSMLSLADGIEAHQPEQARLFRQNAMSYLHRWQDRGGRIGNVEVRRHD